MVLWIPFWIFKDSYNCNGNNNGNSNDGETLWNPRVYWLVFPSTDRGQVVLRFCKGKEELRGAAVY